MKTMQWAAVTGILAAATAVSSQTTKGTSTLYSADRLIQACRAAIVDYDSKPSKMGADGGRCLGYVEGLTETATMWQVANEKSTDSKVPLFCLSPRATNEVIIRKIPIWAIEHPDDAKGSAIEFVISMLVGNYPCPK